MEGSKFEQIGNITLGCISREARDLLDDIMEAYEEHYEAGKKMGLDYKHPDEVYSQFYWLVRWSGLIERAKPQESN